MRTFRDWTPRICLLLLVPLAARPAHAEDSPGRLVAQAESPANSSVSPLDVNSSPKTAAINEVPTQHPLLPAISLAEGSLKTLQTIGDYEATLVKRERLNGQLVEQKMRLRLREKPFSVYLRFAGENSGREIMYVQGRNGNQMLTHEGSGLKSLVGTVSLATDGAEAMQDNRYPITRMGMRRMLESVLQQWQEETRYGEVEVKFYPHAKLGGRSCKVIESVHPHSRRQFRFHKTRLFLDTESRLPVRVEQYGFPAMPGAKAPLEEEYTYTEIRPNVGLTDRDFSVSNPQYNF